MRKYFVTVLTALIVVALSVLGFVLGGVSLTETQKETFFILLIVCGASALYCFVVGEITRNNSQMDKLWSLLPIAYVWIIAAKGNMNPRLIIYAVIVTLWGLRLTFNFARKGAYHLKFWEGEEDYRWEILRTTTVLKNRFLWAMFDLFFISIYQNALVLAICLPSLAVMSSTAEFGAFDYVAIFLAIGFLSLEIISDELQNKFYSKRKEYYDKGMKLEEMPAPYNLGFNTTGIWSYMRHPNYLGEQGIWLSLYIFVIAAGVANYGIFNWTIVGPLFLIFLFQGSSSFGEKISSGKYPKYHSYQEQVFKYLPFRKFNPDK